MTQQDDGQAPRDAADRAFARRLLAHYDPGAAAPGERAAFDAALHARLARRGRSWLLAPLAAAAAAALAWLLLSPARNPDAVAGDPGAAVAASAWEAELFLGSDPGTAADLDETAMLPDDYQAMAAAFLDG